MADDASHSAPAAPEAPARATFEFTIWSAPMDSDRFNDQVAAIKQVADFDPGSRS